MNYSRKDLNYFLRLAVEASRCSGKLLSGMSGKNRAVIVDSGRDVKIIADRLSERLIVKFLRKETPFPILTEESGVIEGIAGKTRWIVDPLDGTLNFSRGIPVSCVSIALWDGDQPVLGVVYDFNKNELFSGLASGDAWMNGRALKVSAVGRKERAVLFTGFPSKTDFSKKAVASFVRSVRSYKKVRLIGSAALSLAYVASGRADAYYEKDIMIWDIAAGVSIVLGAGGRVSIKMASDENRACIYAANKALSKT